MVWDPQESTGEAGGILNLQKPAGPQCSWYKKRGSTEAQHRRALLRVHGLQPATGSAERCLQSLAAIGAGRLGLSSQPGHMLATPSTSVSLSVPFSQDECQGSLRVGGQRAQDSAWHTGGPQLLPDPSLSISLPGLSPETASLRDEARPRLWHPNRLLEATRERCLAALGQLPLCRGSQWSPRPQAQSSKTLTLAGRASSPMW